LLKMEVSHPPCPQSSEISGDATGGARVTAPVPGVSGSLSGEARDGWRDKTGL